MASIATLQAELAAEKEVVEALTAENEQLRKVLERQADGREDERRERGEASDAHELQGMLATLKCQLSQTMSDNETYLSKIERLSIENGDLRDQVASLKDTIHLIEAQSKETATRYEEERLVVATLRRGLDESKKALAILSAQQERRNSEASLARRASLVSPPATPGTVTPPRNHEVSPATSSHSSLARKASLSRVSAARRGSLKYLSDLQLTQQRLTHFDARPTTQEGTTANFHATHLPRHSMSNSDLARSTSGTESQQTQDATGSEPRKACLSLVLQNETIDQESNSIASTPRFASTTRRASLTAGRRSSMAAGSGESLLRTPHPQHTLTRPSAGSSAKAHDADLPLLRRISSTTLEDRPLTALPEMAPRRRSSLATGVPAAHLASERRRTSPPRSAPSLHAHDRGESDKPLPRLLLGEQESNVIPESRVLELEPSPIIRSSMEMQDALSGPSIVTAKSGRNTTSPARPLSSPLGARSEQEDIVQALSVEAAIEISDLRVIIDELKLRLFEAEEAREASETCVKVLREFIASSSHDDVQSTVSDEKDGSSASTTPTPTTPLHDGRHGAMHREVLSLPPLPTETDDMDDSGTATRKPSVDKQANTRRWGMPTMPKLLPSLSYSGLRRDASAGISTHLPVIVTKAAYPETPASQTCGPDDEKQEEVPSVSVTTRSQDSTASRNSSPSPHLKQPEWRGASKLRHASIGSVNSGTSTISARPSPILPPGIPHFQTSAFSGFSFSAHHSGPIVNDDDQPSPGGSSTRQSSGIEEGSELSPTSSFSSRMGRSGSEASASSSSAANAAGLMMIPGQAASPSSSSSSSSSSDHSCESDTESAPQTPIESVFGDCLGNFKDDQDIQEVRLMELTLTPKIGHAF